MYFYDVRTLLKPFHARTQLVGSPQTRSYVEAARITTAVVAALQINPLFERLGLRATRLQHLVDERLFYSFRMQPEGSITGEGRAACKISGCTFCTSLIGILANRIWLLQTALAQAARVENDRQRQLLPDRFIGSAIPLSTTRAHSPTLAAYQARAFLGAGYDRRTAAGRQELYARVNDSLTENEWTIRSRAFSERADRRAHILRTERFSDGTAEELLAGNILAITEEEFVRNDLHGLLFEGLAKQPRSYYTDRAYVYADPRLGEVPQAVNGVLLTDMCYGTTFSLSARSRYGDGTPTQGIGGQLIERALEPLAVVGYTRAAAHRIPCVEARSTQELTRAVDKIQRIAPGPLLFRGQTQHFSVNRPGFVNEMLYGTRIVDELSLTTAASRAKFEWDHFQYRFQLQAQGLLYADLPARCFDTREMDPEGTLRFDDVEVSRRYAWWEGDWPAFEQACMGIAQHYGIPTDGLDLTSNLGVALWFATSTYRAGRSADGSPTSWYAPLQPNSGRRPVIYLICADVSVESQTPIPTLGGLRSVRAERQHAHLHFGGRGMHTNLCATETIAAIFLSPECVAAATQRWVDVDEFFPDERHDRLYDDLITLRAAARRTNQPWGFDQIAQYSRST
jgi:hypothetical protein